MLEIFQNFEYAMGGAAQSCPLVLAGVGIAVVLSGLCVWLGGLYIRKPLVGVIGAAGGFVLGVVVIDRGPMPVAALAAVAALVAIALEKVFITVLGATLAAVLSFAFLAGPYMRNSETSESVKRDGESAQTSTFGYSEVIAELRAFAVEVAGKARYAGSNMPFQRWALVVVMASICGVAGVTIWPLTAALSFSALGTMLIFFGMTLLLLYKGSSPAGQLNNEPMVYAGVFAGMVIFGTIEQMVLCRRPQTGQVEKKKTDDKEKKENAGIKKRGWRTT